MKFLACLMFAAVPIPIAIAAFFVREAVTESGDMRFAAILVASIVTLSAVAVIGVGVAMWKV